jgi:glycosyltransferase involved in cell wall biosynthesis
VNEQTVGVAMATCNGSRYLAAQLQSILWQDRAPDFLVISDDASTDDTVAVLEEALANAPFPVEVVRNDVRLGVQGNFERVTSLCDTDLVFLADQDDVWDRTKLRVMAEVFDGEVTAAFSDARILGGSGSETLWNRVGFGERERQEWGQGRGFEVLLGRNMITGCTMAVRREVIARARPFPVELMHDQWLGLVACLLGRVVPMSRTLVDYRLHETNAAGLNRREATARLRGGAQRRRSLEDLVAATSTVASRFADDSSCSDERRALTVERYHHARQRHRLSGSSLRRRIPIVWDELRTGRYRRFAEGWRSAAIDLIDPGGRGPI